MQTKTSEIDYAACPLCGRNRVVETHDKGMIKWDFVTDLGAFEFIQVRSGGGKLSTLGGERRAHRKTGRGRGNAPGIGFSLVRAYTLAEVMDDPKYQNVVQGLHDQLILLAKDALRLGFISKNELE